MSARLVTWRENLWGTLALFVACLLLFVLVDWSAAALLALTDLLLFGNEGTLPYLARIHARKGRHW